ncbi:MAG: tyrosine-protein phosphatase [Oscillospiraceae bacterium]|nr:tyrosine-protein phosphatase [Oscillospiraceae bacterium]
MKTRRSLSVVLCLILVFTFLLSSVSFAVEIPSAEEQAAANDHHALGLTGVENARDIGGYYTADGQYRVKTGLLLRTGNLHEATDADIQKLQDLGVSKVIDLRMTYEVALAKNQDVPGAEYIHISPMFIPNLLVMSTDDWMAILRAMKTGVMDTYMANMYRQLVQDPVAIKATKQFFQEVLEADGAPIVWHCKDGKDRTGIMATLLLAALGCDEDVMRAEYLNTNYFKAEARQSAYDQAYKLTRSKLIASEFMKYKGVSIEWFEIALNVMHRQGTIEDYLRNVIGLTDDDFATLRATYLEPVAAEAAPDAALLPAA